MTVQEICLLALESVLEEKSGVYVAGPLDTGLEYYQTSAKRLPEPPDLRERNQRRLSQFAAQVRRRVGGPVIDPGVLRVPGWSGRDYLQFFLVVLERFVREAWFVDGWEFSLGATREFQYCTSRAIRCRDEAGEELTPTRGRELIESASRYVESIGGDASRLRSRLSDLMPA